MTTFTAQKALILNEKNELLLIKYADSKFLAAKLNGKYALPGGKIDYGENPDASLVREVKEETGINVLPGAPIWTYSWTYERKGEPTQINATGRVCVFIDGEPHKEAKTESELTIVGVEWVPIEKVRTLPRVLDEDRLIDYFIANRTKLLNLNQHYLKTFNHR